jgi:hypothetical protein
VGDRHGDGEGERKAAGGIARRPVKCRSICIAASSFPIACASSAAPPGTASCSASPRAFPTFPISACRRSSAAKSCRAPTSSAASPRRFRSRLPICCSISTRRASTSRLGRAVSRRHARRSRGRALRRPARRGAARAAHRRSRADHRRDRTRTMVCRRSISRASKMPRRRSIAGMPPRNALYQLSTWPTKPSSATISPRCTRAAASTVLVGRSPAPPPATSAAAPASPRFRPRCRPAKPAPLPSPIAADDRHGIDPAGPRFGAPLPQGLIADTATGEKAEAPHAAGPRAFGLKVCRATLGGGLPGQAVVIVDPDRSPAPGGLAALREEAAGDCSRSGRTAKAG